MITNRQRPFWRMVELFVARIFRGGGDADAEGLDLGIGLVLTLLAMPGGFVSLLLLEKYGTFAQWLRGITNVDVLQAALPTIFLYCALHDGNRRGCGVAVDAIFPRPPRLHESGPAGRLQPRPSSSPISSQYCFSLAWSRSMSTAVSCILFPTVVAATQTEFLFFVKFAAVHAAGVVLSSIFSFFAVFAMLGGPADGSVALHRPFRRASAYVRGLVVVYLVTLLFTSSAVPGWFRHVNSSAPGWTFLLPCFRRAGFWLYVNGCAAVQLPPWWNWPSSLCPSLAPLWRPPFVLM